MLLLKPPALAARAWNPIRSGELEHRAQCQPGSQSGNHWSEKALPLSPWLALSLSPLLLFISLSLLLSYHLSTSFSASACNFLHPNLLHFLLLVYVEFRLFKPNQHFCLSSLPRSPCPQLHLWVWWCVISQWTAVPLKSQHKHIHWHSRYLLFALARTELDKIRSGLQPLHKYSNTSARSEHCQRMPIAVAWLDAIMHEPWAEGLAEHAPSTATQNARMHPYACTHTLGYVAVAI